jgi:hypothetical protein
LSRSFGRAEHFGEGACLPAKQMAGKPAGRFEGKLVEQNAKDPPASELLEQIKAQKEKRTKNQCNNMRVAFCQETIP